MTLPVVFTANGPSGYNLTKSLRFRASASAYLNRTPASSSNRQTWTWSAWVKPSLLTAPYNMTLFGADNGTDTSLIAFTGTINTPTYQINIYNGNGAVIRTTQVFRDPSAWYHIVVVSDTTNATSSNRTRLYINGSQVTAFDSATYPSQNGTGSINSTTQHDIGKQTGTSRYFDGYMAEMNFVDGQALTPSSFGSTNALTGVWQPAKYSGTYGTNGFYLPFNNGGNVSANYLVVAGGGAGGSTLGGGGGAGGFQTGTLSINYGASYAVTVGAGGVGTLNNSAPGANGANSVFSSITSIGGGGGAGCLGSSGQNGGSGGGGSSDFNTGGQTPAGAGTSGQGNNGGSAAGAPFYPAGGGGGAGAVGQNGTGNGGAGGAGTASSITGSSVTYATGGTGGSFGLITNNGADGAANTGNGGGGGATISGTATGGSGGSGIVVISYAGSAMFTGGTITSSSGNTIHTFTSSGTLSPNTGTFNDYSGNGNNWTPNNISLTTGSTYDSMNDVPTLTSATTANYCVLNPLDKGSTSSFTFSDGNLKSANSDASNNYMGRATLAVSSGKWYWEVTLSSGSSAWAGGIATTTTGLSYGSLSSGSAYAYSNNGNSYNGQTGASYGATYTTGDVIGVALDLDAGTLVFYKNGTSQGTAFTGISGTYAPAYLTNSSTVIANFGQQPFSYTPPTGFVALNTYNLPTNTIVKGNTVMDATVYTGNDTTNAIVNTAGFQPDMVWLKNRATTGYDHQVYDFIRGTGDKGLVTNGAYAEAVDTGYINLVSFNSNGFTLGATASTNIINKNAQSHVGWQWQAGKGVSSSNTSGSITSTVSVNATAGFSVVTYSANGSTGTIGHGLGVAPKMIIVKKRNAVERWCVYHTSISNGYIYLNETFALETGNAQLRFGDNSTVVQPTSSVFSVGSANDVNASGGTYVAYCWSEIAGFSKFTSYVGNASTDGPFVYCGFRPKFIMTKATSTGSIWGMWDSSRNTYNAAGNVLQANTNDAEISPYNIDILSNGFKMRDTNSNWNGSGQTFIVMAFAENPFKNALAR